MKPRGNQISWYTCWCIYTSIFMDTLWILVWWWWLYSTTGPYGRTFLEVAYGKMIFHSIEAVWEMVAREEWLECQYDASHMLDIPGSTLVWALYIYILFFDFLWYKNLYKYVLVLKSICIIKEHWWTLTLSWPDKVQRMFSTTYEIFKSKTKITDDFMIILYKRYDF